MGAVKFMSKIQSVTDPNLRHCGKWKIPSRRACAQSFCQTRAPPNARRDIWYNYTNYTISNAAHCTKSPNRMKLFQNISNTIVALHLRMRSAALAAPTSTSYGSPLVDCNRSRVDPTKDFNRFDVWPLCHWRFDVSNVCTVALSKYSSFIFISVWRRLAPFIGKRPALSRDPYQWWPSNPSDRTNFVWNYKINWLSQNINVGSMMARPSRKECFSIAGNLANNDLSISILVAAKACCRSGERSNR